MVSDLEPTRWVVDEPSKKADTQKTFLTGETSNRTHPARKSDNKSASELSKSLNDATTNQNQHNHSSSSQAKSGEQLNRPLKFKRTTASAKTYRNLLKSKRDNHKEFLYDKKAKLVEKLALIPNLYIILCPMV